MTTRYFYGAAQEEYSPEDLLHHAAAAADAGFQGLSTSDHLQPWWEPGESGHAWVWLGAAGHAVPRLPLGTGVTATGARYHPAMIAQAWMTLERLFPGRPFLGIGSGEALNEVPAGDDWPPVGEQIARLDESLGFIRRLWDGERITEQGRFYTLRDTKLHTLADRRPPIWVSAFGPQAAEVAGRHGDGLWTLPDPDSTPEVIDAYREARAKAGHEASEAVTSAQREAGGEVIFQALVAWAESDQVALESVRKWKGAQPDDHYTADWHDPDAMYRHGEREMSDDEFLENAIVGSDPEMHAERLRELEQLGATVIVVQNNSPDPLATIRTYAEHVLPALKGSAVR